jgi:alkaline phosphatase D
MRRREFLLDLTRLAALSAMVPNDWRVRRRARFADDPFALGVASGEPTSSGATLWTRLAPSPLEPFGGMNGARFMVDWEIADDEAFAAVVAKGQAAAIPELSYSVHVDVNGLAPDRWYFYRFHSGLTTSPVGRVRTTPAAAARVPLRLAVASCQHWENGLYTAHEHLAREDIDLVAFLGDYIYETGPGVAGPRRHATPEAMTLDGYRLRYAQYKTDPALQAVHARFPWVLITDDHEVDNNYAGDYSVDAMVSTESMRARRAAAYQAWWEHQPVRLPRPESWANLRTFRRLDWGDLARVHLLAGRQYRSDQACDDGDRVTPCGDWADPKRTMLGNAQERWLSDGLASSKQHWQVLANQVMLAGFDRDPGPKKNYHMDKWSGYPAATERLLASIAAHAPNRTITISGDIHSNWVNELHTGFARPDRPIVAAEFVGTSISSGGDGSARSFVSEAQLRDNPQLKWQNNRRGYIICRADEDAWYADYRTVPFVTKPGAPVETPSRWRVEHGRPGIVAV